MLIQELSQRTGLSKDTIRYYEKIGLIPNAKRNSSGYREYSESLIEKINMISVAKELGFSLNEIKELTKLLFDKSLTRKVMANKLERKLIEIDQRIKSLNTIKKEIRNVLAGNCQYRSYLEK